MAFQALIASISVCMSRVALASAIPRCCPRTSCKKGANAHPARRMTVRFRVLNAKHVFKDYPFRNGNQIRQHSEEAATHRRTSSLASHRR
jgi:hypothetical protein